MPSNSSPRRVPRALGRTVSVLLICLSSGLAWAQPANDSFSTPLDLIGPGGQLSGDNRGASLEPGEDMHADAIGGRSVWFRWTAPQRGLVTFYSLGSDFDTLLAVYVGDAVDALTLIVDNDDTPESSQSRLQFQTEAGREYRIALDGWNLRQGNWLLTWALTPTPAGPANDLFANRIALEGPMGTVFGSNRLGAREPDEPMHFGESAGSSVWYSFSSPTEGRLRIDTDTSEYDAAVSIYRGDELSALERIAQEIGAGFGMPAVLEIDTEPGVEYQIAVDGLNEERGVFVLNWVRTVPCFLPTRPSNPGPADSAVDVDLAVRLQWGRRDPADAIAALIHGEDDRQDAHEVIEPDRRALFDSVAALVSRSALEEQADGSYRLLTEVNGPWNNLCDEEPFFDQPVGVDCTGFLAGATLLATASPCLRGAASCEDLAVIFGYQMLDGETAVTNFPADDIYFCADILSQGEAAPETDWTLLVLDREVSGRSPLRIRRAGEPFAGDAVFSIGYPGGLPAKLTDAATVLEVVEGGTFTSDLDVFQEGIGSPVFDAENQWVEGIVTRGGPDFEPDAGRGCNLRVVCEPGQCVPPLAVSVAQFASLVPPDLDSVTYEVWLAPCGEELTRVGTTTERSLSLDGLLAPSTFYCWRVDASNECGTIRGVEWTFATGVDARPRFRRGDFNADGVSNVSDAVATLGWLFRGAAAPDCLESADIDDSGQVNLSDPLLLLNFLFLLGIPPAPPFDACGIDPTEDTLSCDSFPPCAA